MRLSGVLRHARKAGEGEFEGSKRCSEMWSHVEHLRSIDPRIRELFGRLSESLRRAGWG